VTTAERLNVALVTTTYWPDPIGISVYATEMAEHLVESGHQVRVLTSIPHYPQWRINADYRGAFRRHERRNGVEITRLWLYVPRQQSAARRATYEATFLAHGLVAQLPPRGTDVVLSMIPNVGNGVIGSWWARRARAPHVMFVQDLSGNGAQEAGLKGGARVARVVSGLEAWLARRADLVTVCSEGFRPSLERGGVTPSKIVNFPNWCCLGDRRGSRDEVRERLGWGPEDLVVLHAGNMGMKQGLEHVADYARVAGISGPGLRFVLMGDGSQRPLLDVSTRSLSNVDVLDPVPETNLPDVLAAADVLFVHERPSLREMSIPSKLTAYFAAGRPVVAAVASEGLTAREVRRSGGGIVVPAGEPLGVVRALAAIGTDPGRAEMLGAAAKRYATTHYGRDAAMRRLDELILRALSGPG
jgi:colanic acid biosynthesis glycosyl transferase WcaI